MDVHSQADADVSAVPSSDEIDAISSRRFSSSFRGWNADEVRVHLVEVAEMVRGLARRHGELQRQLAEAEAAARRADLTRLDPDEVGRVLGEETARVLRAARESAAEIEAKARAQAELLASQAADDAARVRAEARDEAERVRAEAEETASAVRTAGSAHVEDLRAAAEAELAEERTAMTEQLAEERDVLHAEIAALRAAAVDEAADIRRVAEADAEAVRTDANRYAEALRAEADADAARLRSDADEAARDVTARAAGQVADAERLRDRILADLARKRRAARQHLEQLHAGRDRLLTAYEVILATTDEAMAELDVVLPEAKRTADDAARRVAGEALPTPEEMLAELQEARERDPSMGRPVPVADPAPDTDGFGDADDDPTADDGAGPAAEAGDDGTADDHGDDEPTAEPGDTSAAEGDDPPVPTSDADRIVPVTDVDPDPAAVRAGHRRTGRRGKRRHDPLGGDALPDVPMVPVAAAAEFESVRVMSSAEAAEVTGSTPTVTGETGSVDTDAPDTDAAATDAVETDAADGPDPEPVPVARTRPTIGSERSSATPTASPRTAPVTARGGTDRPGSGTTPRATPGPAATSAPVPVPAETDLPASSGTDTGPSHRERSDDDAVTDIFARLRAERAGEAPAGDADPVPAGTDTDTDTASDRAAANGSAPEPAATAPTGSDTATAPPVTAGDDTSSKRAGGRSTRTPSPATGPDEPSGPGPSTAKTSPPAPERPEAASPEASRTTGARPGATKKGATKKGTTKKAEGTGVDAEKVAALFERRDAAVDDAARLLSKHLKRTLSDQQSDLLDRLRRTKGQVDAGTLLGDAVAFTGGWDEMIRADLSGAVEAGVALVADLRPGTPTGVETDLSAVVAELIETIAAPLRSRLSRVLDEDVTESDEADRDDDEREIADRIRACYREWRGARLTSAVSDVCARAFGLGVRAAVPAAVDLHWYCGPGDAPCSDCNDNRLAGGVAAGDVFPTGRAVAPAHPGCRCLALPHLG